MTSSSGFPICLSGIQILPQIHPSSHRRYAHSPAGSRARPSRRIASDATNLASECRNSSISSTPAIFQAASADKRESEFYKEAENAGGSRMCMQKAWPRFTLAKEMAELDRRREALKKQRRLRNLLRGGNTDDAGDYRVIYGRTGLILAVLEAQSRQQDASDCTEGVCAKAA